MAYGDKTELMCGENNQLSEFKGRPISWREMLSEGKPEEEGSFSKITLEITTGRGSEG